MYAVIVSGGTQHRVSEGDVLRVEKIEGAEPGTQMELDRVLAAGEGTDLQVGTPEIAGAKVLATVVENGRGKKIVVFKKKRRKQYRRTQGHRQAYTELRIDRIVTG
jgi:large subunit ribosomal protein L21